ncbi:MAG: P-type conjugative transfer ATPase TrbB [Pseudonocardiaceae bacterium]
MDQHDREGADAEKLNRLMKQTERLMGALILEWLRDPSVIEIMLNPDGQLWVERMGEPMSCGGKMNSGTAEQMIKNIASMVGEEVNKSNPILECELPMTGERFEALLPPLVEGPSFTLRRKALRVFTLKEYVDNRVMTERQAQVLHEAVIQRENILVVGGTGSGKTTLTNAILHEISVETPQHRVVFIEDTRELQRSSPNAVGIKTTERFDIQRALKATMRLRPDRVIVGEVRGGEALGLIKAWNTGHPGGVATVHANGGREGLGRLEDLVGEARVGSAHKAISAAVNIVVVISKTNSGRRITEMLRVKGHDGKDYITQNIDE